MKRLLLTALAGTLLAVTTVPASAQLRRYQIRLVNKASYPIMEVYVRNLETDEVSDDLLGDGMIRVGGWKTINLQDGTGSCIWRVQAKLVTGESARREMNVCETASLTITD